MSEDVKELVSDILVKRNLGSKFGINEDGTNTNLVSKHYSPLIVVRVDYNYLHSKDLTFIVGVIADPSTSRLEDVIKTAVKTCEEHDIRILSGQTLRDISGVISETIVTYYNNIKANSVEGVAVLAECDKIVVSSLYGDFMNHLSCKIEFYSIADHILSGNFQFKDKIKLITKKLNNYVDKINNYIDSCSVQ